MDNTEITPEISLNIVINLLDRVNMLSNVETLSDNSFSDDSFIKSLNLPNNSRKMPSGDYRDWSAQEVQNRLARQKSRYFFPGVDGKHLQELKQWQAVTFCREELMIRKPNMLIQFSVAVRGLEASSTEDRSEVEAYYCTYCGSARGSEDVRGAKIT